MLSMVLDLEVFKDHQYFQNLYASSANIHHLDIKAMPNEFNIFGVQKASKT